MWRWARLVVGGVIGRLPKVLRLDAQTVWIHQGTEPFGGGTATLFMIRRAAVDQHRWLSPEEFTRDWAISQAAPGINLLCITILLGRRVRGLAGALVALFGLLLPSVTITASTPAASASSSPPSRWGSPNVCPCRCCSSSPVWRG